MEMLCSRYQRSMLQDTVKYDVALIFGSFTTGAAALM